MKAFVHSLQDYANWQAVSVKIKPLPGHGAGNSMLSYTSTGYGSRLPTVYMIRVNGKWRRVYARCFSNSSTCFIGKRYDGSCIVEIEL